MENNKNLTLATADSLTLAHEAVRVLLEKKALDVKLFSVREHSSITDYFINLTGRSATQVAALADHLIFEIGEKGRDPLRVEGKRGTTWFLVDFGDVIVNIFDRPSREFYNLERLMPEGAEVSIEEDISFVDAKLSASVNKNV